jgi:hypothetical protein
VSLHGYRRNTVDLDILIRPNDTDDVRSTLESAQFEWSVSTREFRSASG